MIGFELDQRVGLDGLDPILYSKFSDYGSIDTIGFAEICEKWVVLS